MLHSRVYILNLTKSDLMVSGSVSRCYSLFLQLASNELDFVLFYAAVNEHDSSQCMIIDS